MLFEISEEDLHDTEEYACREDNNDTKHIRNLILMIHSLKHELNHPAYSYAGGANLSDGYYYKR